jgi:hypothetical protein
MRYVIALLLAVVMLMVVPWLWQRAMIQAVNEVASGPSAIPVAEVSVSNFGDVGNVSAAINPPIDIDTKEYEQRGVQSKVDETQREVRQAETYVER